MTIGFENSNVKIPKYGIIDPKFQQLFFHESLLLGKFEVADLKDDNSFLKILIQKCPNKIVLASK